MAEVPANGRHLMEQCVASVDAYTSNCNIVFGQAIDRESSFR